MKTPTKRPKPAPMAAKGRETMTDTVIGYKLLEGDHSLTSTYGVVTYPADGEWHEVPGNGAYVAVSGGLYSADVDLTDPQLVKLECRDEVPDVSPKPPEGVRCFRWVRRSRDTLDYARVAKTAAAWDVRWAAVEQIMDPGVLADVAKNHADWVVRRVAVARITDPGVLADVAMNDVDWEVRWAAVGRIKQLQEKP
jgi:hypothetical protein